VTTARGENSGHIKNNKVKDSLPDS